MKIQNKKMEHTVVENVRYIELTHSDLIDIVKERLERTIGEKVSTIEFNIKVESEDTGWGPPMVIHTVDGATVYLEEGNDANH